MAKISERDVSLTFGNLAELRRDGWISTETGDDIVVALAIKSELTERGGTGELEITNPDTNEIVTVDFEVNRGGVVTFALRARCECGNPYALCHPEA